MPTDIDPIAGNWYYHLDKGQRFFVVEVDEEQGLVELQHFDGDVEEISLEDWAGQDIELGEEPQSWSGPIDIAETDDLGTEITDTAPEDWVEPEQEFSEPAREKLAQAAEESPDAWGEGSMEEEPWQGEP